MYQGESMPVIYDVTVQHTGAGDRFRVTWESPQDQTSTSFISVSSRVEQLLSSWKNSRSQPDLGQTLFQFLDGGAEYRNLHEALKKAAQQNQPLHINLKPCDRSEDWPFELLADNDQFLLLEKVYLVRRVSDRGMAKEVPPEDRPLKLLFMAASPLDVSPELDYERAEEAIQRIAQDVPMQLAIEDSGSLEGLRLRLLTKQYDVVHLAGHADIDRNDRRPFLQLEDNNGREHKVYRDILHDEALIENPPRLLFISGCRTGESRVNEGQSAGSFTRSLVEKNFIPAVLGWGRRVNDQQANQAERVLYENLSRGCSIPGAVQTVRAQLTRLFPGNPRPAWPLLRLYSNGIPLEPIVIHERETERAIPPELYTTLENSNIKIMHEGFVGRRRQLQAGLGVLENDRDKVGILLLGTGGLGKSCLAGKITERYPSRPTIIVEGTLAAPKLHTALKTAFEKSGDEEGLNILKREKSMADVVANLCAVSFKEKNYLLLLDAFDRNLEKGEDGLPGVIMPEVARLLHTLLYYLPFSGGMTHLLITSRFSFSLADRDRDMVEERLGKVWLTEFSGSRERKKLQALEHLDKVEDWNLKNELIAIGSGNPLLMEQLNELTGQVPRMKSEQLLSEAKTLRANFIAQLGIRELYLHTEAAMKQFLGGLSVYSRPVSKWNLRRVAELGGVTEWETWLELGKSLGLVEFSHIENASGFTRLLKDEVQRDFKPAPGAAETAHKYYTETLSR